MLSLKRALDRQRARIQKEFILRTLQEVESTSSVSRRAPSRPRNAGHKAYDSALRVHTRLYSATAQIAVISRDETHHPIRTDSKGMSGVVPVHKLQKDANQDETASVSTALAEADRILSMKGPIEVKHLEQAAKDLLNGTKSPSLPKSLYVDEETLSSEAKRIHRAIIVVVSQCIKATETLTLGTELTRRAHILDLPFHLPLYRDLITAIARFSEDNHPLNSIVEVCSWIETALKPSLEASFFDGAIISFARRGQYENALGLLDFIEDRYLWFDAMSPVLATNLLEEGTKTWEVNVASLKSPKCVPSEAALELYERSIDVLKVSPMEKLNEVRQELEESFDSDSDFDDYDDDYDLDDFDDDEDSLIRDLENSGMSRTQLLQELQAYIERRAQKEAEENPGNASFNRQIGNLLTNEVQKVIEEIRGLQNDDPYYHDDRVAESNIYLRDTYGPWDLPDVTEQFRELNDGKEIRFSKEYEKKLLRDEYDLDR